MIRIKHIKGWFLVHKWTSLICTVFLLEICLTGLPLVFSEEIDHWLNPGPPYAVVPEGSPKASLDNMVHTSLKKYPNDIITSIFVDDDEPQVIVSLSTSWKEAMKEKSDSNRWIRFDAHTAGILEESRSTGEDATFTGIMLELHMALFAGLPGELFLALMGLLFVAALVSGAVLYGPFMKKLDFGTVRHGRSRRLKWLDLHNLLGIVMLAWMLVVGATGVMNELSEPLFGLWEMTDVKKVLASYKDKPVSQQSEMSSVQAALDQAEGALPGMTVTSIVFPGAPFASPRHYLLWAKGNTPLRSQLFDPVLVDAGTGRLSAIVNMPWYLRTLEISRPLHFGDYGGMPLKILWAIFDVAAIIVLISGLYLWFVQRRSRDAWLQRVLQYETAQPLTVPENEEQ